MMPEQYDIRDLRELLEEVEVLLFPNDRRTRPVISYEVQEGSVRNIFRTGVQAIAQTGAILSLVAAANSLDVLEPRTAKAIETLQRRAQQSDLAFTLRTSMSPGTELRIDRNTHYIRSEASSVETEVYLYGRVVDAGGKERPNIHLQVNGQGTYLISASEEQIKGRADNYLYRTMGVRAVGRQDLQTGAIEKGSLKLLELIDFKESFEENYLKGLQAKASSWLKDIDPDQYLNDVRGEYGA